MRVLTGIGAVVCIAACVTAAPARMPAARTVSLTLDEAKALVADFEARQARESDGSGLREPKSLDDVLEILKRDQLDLFPAGVAFAAKTPDDPKAAALQAQIELSWGEALQILGEVFADVTGQLRQTAHDLEIQAASGELSDKQQQRLEGLRETLSKNDGISDALSRLAAEHVGIAARLAKEIIAKSPSDYHGYRVAADYYRLRGDWANFDEMMKKLEAANPGSNGLVFLRGTSALTRDGDAAAATRFLRQALENDPKFTRAQALLVLSRSGVRDTYAEYQKLRALNPHHQIVVWVGEAFTQAFEAQRSR